MASQAPTDREPSAPAPSLFDVLTPLLRRWRMMIVIPSVCGAAAGAVSLVLPPGYTATTSFTTDLSPATVVTMYLLPNLNARLLPRLARLRAGTRVVSHSFELRGVRSEAAPVSLLSATALP